MPNNKTDFNRKFLLHNCFDFHANQLKFEIIKIEKSEALM